MDWWIDSRDFLCQPKSTTSHFLLFAPNFFPLVISKDAISAQTNTIEMVFICECGMIKVSKPRKSPQFCGDDGPGTQPLALPSWCGNYDGWQFPIHFHEFQMDFFFFWLPSLSPPYTQIDWQLHLIIHFNWSENWFEYINFLGVTSVLCSAITEWTDTYTKIEDKNSR